MRRASLLLCTIASDGERGVHSPPPPRPLLRRFRAKQAWKLAKNVPYPTCMSSLCVCVCARVCMCVLWRRPGKKIASSARKGGARGETSKTVEIRHLPTAVIASLALPFPSRPRVLLECKPPHGWARPTKVYRATYRRVAERNRRFYKRYPGDVDKVQSVLWRFCEGWWSGFLVTSKRWVARVRKLHGGG